MAFYYEWQSTINFIRQYLTSRRTWEKGAGKTLDKTFSEKIFPDVDESIFSVLYRWQGFQSQQPGKC